MGSQPVNRMTLHHCRSIFRVVRSCARILVSAAWLFGGLLSASVGRGDGLPLQLHPDNPHYFLWRGRPTVLITSGEHYGAVLNADFDYEKYLDTLAKDRLNLTRVWTGGTYCESTGAFDIEQNSLAPLAGRLLCPFARSDQPGYKGGGNKFDLERWDEDYFRRLRDFVAKAGQRGVVVEVNLFCPFYEDAMWALSPLHPANNINGVGAGLGRKDVLTLDKHGGTLALQERLVRRFVAELRDFDNVYYEICNEPYAGGVPLDWQRHMADVIAEAQREHPFKKLISQNVANGRAKVVDPPAAVSIFNFHYATPPDAVEMNYALDKAIGDDETGFKGTGDGPYRAEAWEFIIAGGALFNHLDYSFTAGHEDGTFVYGAKQPGGGNPGFRRQMRILRDFIDDFEFVKMKPDRTVIRGGVPKGTLRAALAEAGKAYAIYLRRGVEGDALEVELPAGEYRAEWISPLSGEVMKMEEFAHEGGARNLAGPAPGGEIALRIKRR
jgi:hypothetical protein